MIATRIYRCSKNGARDLQIFEEYVFYQVRKMVTGLQRKWWFSKTLKKAYTSDKIEAYRFSLWFYKNSIRWSLPKKCITSLLILTFLKFNEKRNIIHAHRNLISQFVPYEKSAKRTARLSNFWRVCVLSSAKNGHWSAAKMVVFKTIKKSLYQWSFLKSDLSDCFFLQNLHFDSYPKNASRPC